MRPRRDPVPRAREAWWWLGGVLTLGVVGAGVVAAGVALWENVDVRQLAPDLMQLEVSLPEPVVATGPARRTEPFRAVLFESASSATYFDDPAFYPGEMARWRALLESTGADVTVVRSAAGIEEAGDALLVVPEAPCLASAERSAIMTHILDGGSVVGNWALGVRDADCAWLGWETLREFTSAEDVRELGQRDGLFVTVPGSVPSSAGLEAGSRIELKPEPAVALRLGGPRVYWSDWALNPVRDADGVGADVAVATTTTGHGGRLTWFGMHASQGATASDADRLERLLGNGIAWAAGLPSASPASWPGAARSALVFVMDVEGADFWAQAGEVASAFEESRTPISFFVVSQLVEDDPELAARLTQAGEVGTQTVSHSPLWGLTAQEQRMRLQRSFDDVKDWTGVEPLGLRPPEEAFDSLTLEAWRAAGGRYLVSSTEARSATPEIHRTTRGDVIVLPRLLKDDYTVIVRDVTLRSERLLDAYLNGLAKMRAIGGLAVVAGHTQIISNGPRLDAFAGVARSAADQGDWWVAEAGETAEWWSLRSRVRLEWRSGAGGGSGEATPRVGYELVVHGPPDSDIDELWIDVVLPGGDAGLPHVDGAPVDHIEEPWGMRVRMGAIPAGGFRVISWVQDPTGAPEEGP